MKIMWCFVFYLVFNEFQTIASKLQSENEDTNLLMNLMQSMEALEKLVDKSLQIQDKKFVALEKLLEENKASSLKQNQQNFGALKTLLEENKASDASSFEQNQQKFGALEKLLEENKASDASSFEQNQQNFGALKTLFEESIETNNKKFGALEKLHEENVERVDCGERCEMDDSCVSVFWSNSSDSECRFNQDKSTLVKFLPGEIYYCKDCQTTLDLVFEAEYAGVIKLTNVATNKTTQSSSYANAKSDPSKAVDGDPNTWFSSEVLLTKEEPWLMIDLGQRFLVAQIKIQVRGGYFQVCLVDEFDRKLNPCNQHTEILNVNRRLIAYTKVFDVKMIIMGRYVVIKKLKEDSLEIAELEVLSVIPIMSYECTICLAGFNTVCDESRIPPVCSCAENHLPVDGDARNGCKDPCLDFNEANAVCDRVDHETRRCSCNAGYHPVRGDSCNGCSDPCNGFKDRNNICLSISFEQHSCECKKGHFEIIKEDPCVGCLDPCINFREQNTLCLANDGISYNCSCEQGFIPVHDNEPCHGCKKVCPSSLDYINYRDFGCLKVHKTKKKWEDARSSCISEGGEIFSPGNKLPLLPKDEMNLEYPYFWIGARRRGNGPYERDASGEELADDSKLWSSGYPFRGSRECVVYYSPNGHLFDYTCTSSFYSICQIP